MRHRKRSPREAKILIEYMNRSPAMEKINVLLTKLFPSHLTPNIYAYPEVKIINYLDAQYYGYVFIHPQINRYWNPSSSFRSCLRHRILQPLGSFQRMQTLRSLLPPQILWFRQIFLLCLQWNSLQHHLRIRSRCWIHRTRHNLCRWTTCQKLTFRTNHKAWGHLLLGFQVRRYFGNGLGHHQR